MYKLFLFCFILSSFTSFATKRDSSKVEWIKVYFNERSDHSVALPNNYSHDLYDMMLPLIHRIDSAKFSVDVAAYDFQNMRVAHALANAARRGVRVRVVTDNSTRNRVPKYNTLIWDTLRKAGIYSIDDAGTVYFPDGKIVSLAQNLPNAGAIMHHKFAVIDNISEDPEDKYVWTGTMNLTYTGPWNTNATLVIKDNRITETYAEEFEQMWGSKTIIPNANSAKFHKDKHKSKNNIHFVGNIRVEAYFGPMDRGNTKPSISKRITELIEKYALHDVNFLAFAISSNIPLSQAMIDRSGRGEIYLNGVIDPAFYARYRNTGDIWTKPEMSFGKRSILPGKEVRKLHEKTIIIDARYPYPEQHKSVVLVGSYNFSKAAELANDENILMIFDNKIANQFYQDFSGVQNRAKGISYHRYPEIDTSKWYTNFKINDNGTIDVELDTTFMYPVSLLGIELPRIWAGHKDSSFYYSAEANAYLKELLQGTSLKFSAGKEKPEHYFNRYFAYVTARKDSINTQVNHELLATGNAIYSKRNRQQEDSIQSFLLAEKYAKEHGIGIWAHPELINTKKLTPEAEKLKNLFPLDINYASIEDLMLIKGVGIKTATSIVEYRQENGYFNTMDELLGIKGIGPATLEKLKEYLFIGN
ncbi:MAG: helix-hairpin-helix domain-containing protein [Brumimicrobium sp.]|nr:helix-hairpin-helix domain-containing protein [Brumimicrobium sp.]